MSSRRTSTVQPVIREVKPDNASTLAPASPNGSPRVRFAATLDNSVSRPLTTVEAWSLYHFETHAHKCDACYARLTSSSRKTRHLCAEGHALAQDVDCHVYARDGEYYERLPRSSTAKPARVEVPHGYVMLKALLKRSRKAPIVSYDPPSYYDSSDREDSRPAVVLEPGDSSQSKFRSTRYATRVVDPDVETSTLRQTTPTRRGTLYERDMSRPKANYRVEVREPSARSYSPSRRRSTVYLY